MKILLDCPAFMQHETVASGPFECMPAGRMYDYPDANDGPFGTNANSLVQADAVADHFAAAPALDRTVYLKGFGIPVLDIGRHENGRPAGPSEWTAIGSLADNEIDVERPSIGGINHASWVAHFFNRLTERECRIDLVHIDAEWYWNFWELATPPEERDSQDIVLQKQTRNRVLDLMATSGRFLRRMGEHAENIKNKTWTPDTIKAYNRHAAKLTASACSRLLRRAGYNGPIAAFGYWQGAELNDANGWPISSTTADFGLGCYGAYGNGASVSDFAARLVRNASRPTIPVLNAEDDPTITAHRLRTLDALGTARTIIWTPNTDLARANLTAIANALHT